MPAKKLKDRVLSLADYIELQDKLNDITMPGWRNVGGKNQLTVDHFLTEFVVESVELVDSGVEHKWWKHIDPAEYNEYNVKIELIDMFHFYLGALIILLVKDNKLVVPEDMDEMFFGCDVTTIFNQEFDLEKFDRLIVDGNKLHHASYIEAIRSILQLPDIASNAAPSLFNRVAYGLMNGIFTLARMPADEISAVYRAKCELNRIRQSKGYKNGTYVKVVDGVEDNERMRAIIEEFMSDKQKTLAWVAKSVRDKFFTTTA